VLVAAHELFVAQGYEATTVEQIAARAGVSKPTVFTSVGSKQALLKVVREVAMAGDDEPVPVPQRPGVQRILAAPGAAEAVVAVAAHVTQLVARYADVEEVLRGAAAGEDPELRALWEMGEQQRRAGAALLLGLVSSEGPLRPRLSAERAADVLSHLMAPDGYRRLVHECGWSDEEYAVWLAEVVAAQLLP
jgi:AcrR family transcriptional regulator